MRLVKVGANHSINADRMIEVSPHLVEPGLTIVMAAPQPDANSDTESALLTIYTIDLHGEQAENVTPWLETVAEDGVKHASLPSASG